MTIWRASLVRSIAASAIVFAYGCGQAGSDEGDGDSATDASIDVAQHDTPGELDVDADTIAPCNSPNYLVRCKGLCVDLGKDPNNCGACGNKCCPAQGCGDGRCVGGCPPGYTECPDPHGCFECIDLTTDPKHCGGCDVGCPSGTTCVDGSCATPDAGSDTATDSITDAASDGETD